MQNVKAKRRILPLIIIAIALALFALAFVPHVIFAAAEGNDAGGHGTTDFDIVLTLDINGRSNTAKSSEQDKAAIDNNNKQHLKARVLTADAVANYKNDSGSTSSGNQFVIGSIYCDSNSTVSVEIDSTNSSYLNVRALAVVSDARFTVSVVRNGSEKTVSFKVVVEETFAQLASPGQNSENGGRGGWTFAGSDKSIRIGEKVSSGVIDPSTIIDNFSNYTRKTFSLSDYFVNRALYCMPDSAATSTHSQLITTNATDNTPWVISQATGFTISKVTFESMEDPISYTANNPSTGDKEKGEPATRFAASVTVELKLTDKIVDLYLFNNSTKYSDPDAEKNLEQFWKDTHYLYVTLTWLDINSADFPTSSFVIRIPINIIADRPQSKTIPSRYLNLNITSTYDCDYNGGSPIYTYEDADGNTVSVPSVDRSIGYRTLIIRPSDVVEYSHPASVGEMTFAEVGTDVGGEDADFRLVPIGNELKPSGYKIIAQKNNQYSIKLHVNYKKTGINDVQDMYVTLSVNGYGNYDVTFNSIQGKKPVTYNVLSASEFRPLLKDGYQMTKVTSNNPDQLDATVVNNILTLKPNLDRIEGQANASVTMQFTNQDGLTIQITSNTFGIDVKAGSFFNRFEDWQAWLIIAACIIGGIMIILLIVWIFIHSISKHKQEENATAAPVSSYIVKLNSTIAATQAQQRLAATQALSQASNQMLLGAGPTGTQAPPPDTLQLATGMPSAPSATQPLESAPSNPAPVTTAPPEPEENYNALIAKYITDEELLERIFVEKYEPKGMVRRTFFKSKDLQARELEKEKNRIIERYKSPMPMDEAIMSEAEIKKAEEASTPSTPSAPQEVITEQVFDLGFDPDAPLYVVDETKDEFSDEKIDIDVPPEQSKLNDVERQNEIILKELDELKFRIDKVQKELDKNRSLEDELRERIAKAEADDDGYAKSIEDLEFKLASAKAKEKDKITRDISTTETKKERNLKELERLRAELDRLLGGDERLNGIMIGLSSTKEEKIAAQSGIATSLEKAQAEYSAYQDRMAKVKAQQELQGKLEGLMPMLVAVNTADHEMRDIENNSEKLEKERDALKSEVSGLKTQILGTTDFDVINELNMRISDVNARLSEIDKELTKSVKRKSELNIEFTSQRRKANDFVTKNDIPLEDLISAEDEVIGNIAFEVLRAQRESNRDAAEHAVAIAQASLEDITASSQDITVIAMEVASTIQDLEAELKTTQDELDAINAQMENATDDEKLMLMVDQSEKSDKVEELTEKIKQANVEGTKRKMEVQAQYDENVENARRVLDEANAEFQAETAKCDAIVDTNPLDLIMSGSGIISQDQKKIEANNLKKQLEKSKNEIEQARLAAQMAQMEAEQAKVDASRASDEARAEAERLAQEAIEKAEQARLEAEEKARSEAEAAEQARLEAEEAAEQARREAEEAAEQARREAEELAEQARLEAEEAKRNAEELAEQARREAEEAAERARQEAVEAVQAEAEEAKRKAQEEIEEMRRKAEEEAEAKRKEEEALRREEEERQKADAARKEEIAKKIAMRKEKIVVVRERMKDIKGDEDAKNLREQLYTMQLTFDEDEHASTELMDFYNKTMDDIQHAGEVATLKAENAKKPQRVVKKVTERVNRIPKKKPGAKSGARPGARPGSRAGARPASRAGARPAARPGARPAARPGARPASGARRPSGTRPPTARK